jgi:hypothetical protein
MSSGESIDHDWTDEPVCPYCGGEDQDWWDGLGIEVEDGTEWEATCGYCGEQYKVQACITTTFSTERTS